MAVGVGVGAGADGFWGPFFAAGEGGRVRVGEGEREGVRQELGMGMGVVLRVVEGAGGWHCWVGHLQVRVGWLSTGTREFCVVWVCSIVVGFPFVSKPKYRYL